MRLLPRAQVSDSGKPPRHSAAFVSVRIIEESVYPPAILPLDIYVTTAGDEYPGGVLGKIHATDQDIYDTLAYSLAPPPSAASDDSAALFSVSASDGKVVALRPLDVGHYSLNVTVTDGRLTAAADVTVHVRQATRQALDNSIAVRFANIAPEEFIGDYWRNFQRALRNIAGVRRSEVQLVSLQPSEQGDLDVLLALERSGSPYQSQEVSRVLGFRYQTAVLLVILGHEDSFKSHKERETRLTLALRSPSGRLPQVELLRGRDRGDDGGPHRAGGAEAVRGPGLPLELLRRGRLAGQDRRGHVQHGSPELRHAAAPEDGDLPVRRYARPHCAAHVNRLLETAILRGSLLASRRQMSCAEQPVRKRPLSGGHGVRGGSQRGRVQLCVSGGQKGEMLW